MPMNMMIPIISRNMQNVQSVQDLSLIHISHGLKDHEDLIVNRIRMDMVNRGEMMSIEDVNDILQLNVIGAVPDDENIVVAVSYTHRDVYKRQP